MVWNAAGTFHTRLSATALTAHRKFVFPDQDGTFVIASAGNAAVDRLSASSVFATVLTAGGTVVINGGVTPTAIATFTRSFSGVAASSRIIDMDMVLPSPRGTNLYYGFVASAVDTLVDGSALLGLFNHGNADAIYISCRGPQAGTPTPTGIGIDVNRSGSVESFAVNNGAGIQIWNWTTTNGGGSRCLIIKNQNGADNVLVDFVNVGNNRALCAFQAGLAADQQEGFVFKKFTGTDAIALLKDASNNFIIHDSILGLDFFNYNATTKDLTLLPQGQGGTVTINRNNADQEGAELRFTRAFDNNAQWAIDSNGSGTATANHRLRIFNVLAGVELFAFGLDGRFSASAIAAATISASAVVVNGITLGSAINYQAFTATGTWTKPTGIAAGATVIIEAWAGGGGGRGGAGVDRGGGGGGGFSKRVMQASSLSATVAVTVGAGGAAGGSGGGNGGNGGNTTFGIYVTAFGGSGGQVNLGGGGGGAAGAAASTVNGGRIGGGAGGAPGADASNTWAAGGGGNGAAASDGGFSVYGGGGGAGSTAVGGIGTGGTSLYGGNGGGGVIDDPGDVPAGGGAGGGVGGAGGRGECRVTTIG